MSLSDSLTIDITRQGEYHLPAKQGDAGYNIILTILRDGANIVDWTTDSAEFRLGKPDGTFYTDTAAVRSDNTVSIHVDDGGQMLAAVGKGVMDVTILQGTIVKSTQNFILDIEAAPGGDAVPSQNVVRGIPDPPTTDGTYTLQVTVTDGAPEYQWV